MKRQSVTNILLCAVWGAGILLGLGVLTTYSSTSAQVVPLPNQWPEHTEVTRALHRPTMLLSLHPRCVCSRATIEELARLLARVAVPPQIEILLYQPEKASDSWAETDVVRRARSLPGVTIHPDKNGRESERFRLAVSGQTVLYAADGNLIFTGGITRARGHEGDNAGRDALVSLLASQQALTMSTPVFGCSIRGEL